MTDPMPQEAAAWRALAERALKGADYEDKLVRSAPDGFERGPVFFSAPDMAAAPLGAAPRNPHLPWGSRQMIVEGSPQDAHKATLEDLMGGVSELELRLDPTSAHGLAARDFEAMQSALCDVDLSIAAVTLDALSEQPAHAGVLMRVLNERGVKVARGGLGLSPIEFEARTGEQASDEALGSEARMTLKLLESQPEMTGFRADAALVFEAGGSESQELGFMAACGAAYMRVLIEQGAEPGQAARAVEARLAVDADIHLSLAKLRAARRIWARIAEAFGAAPDQRALRLHAVTARRMLSAKDPWTNLIRNACAGFAAAAGAADAITIRPLTDAIGRPTGFARRVARNLHILLAEESQIGRVADPAAGGYLHENLTQSLAEAGWKAFQAIEARGGAREVIRSGWLASGVAVARQNRIDALEQGEDVLVGVTRYPDPEPRLVETAGAWPDAPESEGALAPILFAEAFEREEEAAQ